MEEKKLIFNKGLYEKECKERFKLYMKGKFLEFIVPFGLLLFFTVYEVALTYYIYVSKNMVDVGWFVLYLLGVTFVVSGIRAVVNELICYSNIRTYYRNASRFCCGSCDEHTFGTDSVHIVNKRDRVDKIVKYSDIEQFVVWGNVEFAISSRKNDVHHIVKMKYFSGATLEEIVALLEEKGVQVTNIEHTPSERESEFWMTNNNGYYWGTDSEEEADFADVIDEGEEGETTEEVAETAVEEPTEDAE